MTLHEEIIEDPMVDIIEEPIAAAVEEPIAAAVEEPIAAAVEEHGISVMGEYYHDDRDYFGYPDEFFENIDDNTRILRRLLLEEENADYYERIDNDDYEDDVEFNDIMQEINYNSRSILRLTTIEELEQQQLMRA